MDVHENENKGVLDKYLKKKFLRVGRSNLIFGIQVNIYCRSCVGKLIKIIGKFVCIRVNDSLCILMKLI